MYVFQCLHRSSEFEPVPLRVQVHVGVLLNIINIMMFYVLSLFLKLQLSPPKDQLSGPESFEAPQIWHKSKKSRDFQSFFNVTKA